MPKAPKKITPAAVNKPTTHTPSVETQSIKPSEQANPRPPTNDINKPYYPGIKEP